ncbi:MAG: hypothetical protein JWP81_988 [Ferruginibacter sp.]|nr:hypothetical protein [Ferruginibacter sp.]
MLKKIIYLLNIVLVICFTSGCKKDVEDRKADAIMEDLVWDQSDSLGIVADYFVNNLYNYLPDGFNRIDGDYLDAATDDAIPSRNSTQIAYFTNGRVSTLNYPDPYFSKAYAGIRRVNILLANLPKMALKNDPVYATTKQYWKAEGRFIRAMCYWELVKRFGSAPLIGDKVFTLNDNLELPRNSFEDCIEYIVGECDAIKDSLRTDLVSTTDWGRIGKGAALALKSRVLLYAASPLYNGGGIEKSESLKKLNGYTDYKVERWTRAANAAKDVLDISAFKLEVEFRNVFTTLRSTEIILATQRAKTTDLENNNSPVGFNTASITSRGYTSSTQELVDAFPMNTGKAITEVGSGYTPQNPYSNRDSRLQFTVFCNGNRWVSRNIETFDGGKDRPGGSAIQTKTGYYARKFMGYFDNPASTFTAYSAQSHNFILFRLGEILLNYAEALNESGRTTEAYAPLIELRKRAKITAGTGSLYGLKAALPQLDMRKLIQNERRIELAFEEHRFWDIRRWKLASTLLNGKLHGIRITKTGSTLTYAVEEVADVRFADRLYKMPIPYSEISKNKNLLQNEGW